MSISRDIVKVILTGDEGSGKSSLLLRYKEDLFVASRLSGMPVTFSNVDVEIECPRREGARRRFPMQVWDVSGEKRFESVAKSFFDGVQAVLLVFDVTKESSISNIGKWVNFIQSRCGADSKPALVLVGSKSDLVFIEDSDLFRRARAIAGQYGVSCMSCSAKSGIGIEAVFGTLARDVATKLDRMTSALPMSEHKDEGGEAANDESRLLEMTPLDPPATHGKGCCSRHILATACACILS